MNRNEIESDPHSLLEGMAIGGYVTGATHGIIYVRAEYPLAVHRLNVRHRAGQGLRPPRREHPGPRLRLRYRVGRGRRRLRLRRRDRADRFARRPCRDARARVRLIPAQKGLWGHPTNINNVETWYNIPPIITKGPAWFTETGSDASAGTKVFSLVGKVTNTGLVEMPLGTPLRTFVYDVGGGGIARPCRQGGADRRPFRRLHPARHVRHARSTTRPWRKLGSIMGSGGMVVMDEDNCMVDVARYFIEFTHSESCGKCMPCRVGLDKALRILNAHHQRRGPRGGSGRTGRTGPDDPRHLALRARADRRRIRC